MRSSLPHIIRSGNIRGLESIASPVCWCADVMIATQPCGSKMPWRVLKSPQGELQARVYCCRGGGWSQIGTIRTSRHKSYTTWLHILRCFRNPRNTRPRRPSHRQGNVTFRQVEREKRHKPGQSKATSHPSRHPKVKRPLGGRAVGRSMGGCPNGWRPGCRVPFR